MKWCHDFLNELYLLTSLYESAVQVEWPFLDFSRNSSMFLSTTAMCKQKRGREQESVLLWWDRQESGMFQGFLQYTCIFDAEESSWKCSFHGIFKISFKYNFFVQSPEASQIPTVEQLLCRKCWQQWKLVHSRLLTQVDPLYASPTYMWSFFLLFPWCSALLGLPVWLHISTNQSYWLKSSSAQSPRAFRCKSQTHLNLDLSVVLCFFKYVEEQKY